MQQTIPTPVTPILPHTIAPDVTLTLTYKPGSPFTLTAVDVTNEPIGHAELLDILFEATQRLRVYIDGYQQAWDEDTATDC